MSIFNRSRPRIDMQMQTPPAEPAAREREIQRKVARIDRRLLAIALVPAAERHILWPLADRLLDDRNALRPARRS